MILTDTCAIPEHLTIMDGAAIPAHQVINDVAIIEGAMVYLLITEDGAYILTEANELLTLPL